MMRITKGKGRQGFREPRVRLPASATLDSQLGISGANRNRKNDRKSTTGTETVQLGRPGSRARTPPLRGCPRQATCVR